MRPFEEEGDTLIRHFTLEQYPTCIARIAREELHCNGTFDAAGITRSMAPLQDFLKDFQDDWGSLAAVASAYVSLCRQVRGKSKSYQGHFGPASATLDPVGDLMPLTALRPRREVPTVWDMRRLVTAMRWLVRSHRPRLERAAGLALLQGAGAWGAHYLATKSTAYLERVLHHGDVPRWDGLVLGREYCHVEKCIFPPNLRYSRDGYWLHMKHGKPGPWHWEASYSYWDLTVLAERVATWDAGWVLGRTVEMVEAEVHTRVAAMDGAEERRSGVHMRRYPWLFDENGDFKPSPH